MSRKKLTKRQQAVIDELFTGELDEQATLDKYGVTRRLFKKWMTGEAFRGEFEARIADSYRRSEMIIARFAPVAAARLVELTGSEKEETRRKACLDIIALPERLKEPTAPQEADEPPATALPPETARRILAALAADDESPEDPCRD